LRPARHAGGRTPYSQRTPIEVVQAGDVVDALQAKSVFLDLRRPCARPIPGEET
jgi:hypothetical protein